MLTEGTGNAYNLAGLLLRQIKTRQGRIFAAEGTEKDSGRSHLPSAEKENPGLMYRVGLKGPSGERGEVEGAAVVESSVLRQLLRLQPPPPEQKERKSQRALNPE
ncbi:hypothetical protein TREES_T100020540 [Tupaia chinensis]|uniref:Uncharacterized protein n=1 Tax=Tupaia chinensis TaxID=246437 RepID=L9KWU4_TUPCH|nr:hypothetical protein TREES_T100020540 [Tupaia chinensis]